MLYEGLQEPNIVEAEPARQPRYEDHLSEDERELLEQQLREHSRGKRTFGLQTETVLILKMKKR